MKHYDLAVIIGRFQPIHKGHLSLFRRASELADTTLCIVGSTDQPRTPENPFTFDERENLIHHAVTDAGLNDVFVEGVRDTKYNNQEWFRAVREIVVPKANEAANLRRLSLRKKMKELSDAIKIDVDLDWNTFVYLHGEKDPAAQKIIQHRKLAKEHRELRICILGYEKDESSWYLRHFADWKFINVDEKPEYKYDDKIHASVIRELWYTERFSFAVSQLSTPVVEFMTEFDDDEYETLVEEYNFVQKYRQETQLGPFPVQFLTTDAVVLHGDEVLLVRRGEAPGKGLWGLPGGFKNYKETFFDSCVRELKEETKIALPEKVIRGSKVDEHMFDHPGRSSRGTTVTMAYLFVLDPEEKRPRVKGGDDAVDAWWFPLSELDRKRDQIFEDHYDIIQYMTARS
jgi:bifunctional NMN adenylyltransferase/nudix hydrolase